MAAGAEEVGSRIAALTPEHADAVRARAADTAARLRALDADIREGLARCRGRVLVTSHAAFGYLAERYGLEQVGVAGNDPDGEPSPRRIVEVVRTGRAADVRAVFTAPGERRTGRGVADELGAPTVVLDTLEAERPGEDYLSVMRRDLTALRTGLGCA